MIAVAGCATHHAAAPAPPVDAAVIGRIEALPDRELRTVAQIARSRLAVIAPSIRIQNLKVFSDSEVGVTFGRESTGPAGYLVVERVRGHWQITSEQKPEGI
jgi:hypothetical protein